MNWFQTCNYALLWRSLYFKEGWTVQQDMMSEFETRLHRMQVCFDEQYNRFHTVAADDPTRLYNRFFAAITAVTRQSCTEEVSTIFRAIARLETGEKYHRAVSFILNNNGSIRVHCNWRYIYINRSLLERNWRTGHFQASVLGGAPDVPHQREGIYCVFFDHMYLAAGSRDNSIQLWDMQDLSYRGSLVSHQGSVLCLELDSKRKLLVSGSSDSTIKVWNLEVGVVSQTLRGHTDGVLGLHFDDQYIVSCSKDNTARVWSMCTDITQQIPVNPLNPDGGDVPAGPFPRYVPLHTLNGHRAAVNSVHFRGNIIATASGDRTVRLWSLSAGTTIRTLSAHPRGVASVRMAGRFVVTGSSDNVLKIFDMTTGEEVRTLRGHNGLVRTIQTDNTKIISGSYDQSIRIWDLHSGEMLQELAGGHDSKYLHFYAYLMVESSTYIGTSGESYRVVEMQGS
jgi:F-box and WD-40 domain protein 1/11